MTAATASKPKRRMTPKQWAEAEALWESGEATFTDLIARFGGNISTYSRHFKAAGIVKGAKSAEHKKAVAAEVTKTALDDATVVAARIRETKEEHYKMSAALAKLTWAEILAAKQDKAPIATKLNNLKALDAAMTVMKKAREERWAVLGLDRPDAVDPDELPELVISELTAEQVQALRDRDHLDDIEIGAGIDAADAASAADGESEDDEDDGVVEEGA